jgi:putative CocE/NonD family hydrolase
MTNIRDSFPHQVRKIENTWIPASDGCRLAASIWLPEDAERSPVPAILEYLPYRKDDSRAVRDSSYHPYFAGHGYAAIRADMRGTGASDGILYDEYLKQEQDDALDVMNWIAAQPWCSGQIGMYGISWGGFNGLQIAARRPPQLKAVISIASTDDRYADDVHYLGGCVLGSDMLAWAARMFQLNALPPDPQLVGGRWREMWMNRLENTPPYVHAWLEHQTRDEFWKQGSVCEDYAAIEAPVYAVGGWGDAYTNAVFRLLEGLPGPKKGLIGPWCHDYPHLAKPGPQIGFLQECLRWWDYWLKGVENGIMDEPVLRVWIQDSVRPAPMYEERPGHWAAEQAWPSPNIQPLTYWLGERTLRADIPEGAELHIRGSQFAGAEAGVWCPYGDPVDLPPDQRREDGLCLTFDAPPVEEAVEIVGPPHVTLNLAADQPLALVAVRLCDVSPTGSSLQVSKGVLNLTHRSSHEDPEMLEPGRFYHVEIKLDVAGHRLPIGHHWRLAVSPTYWPMAWPSPRPVTLRLRAGEGSTLRLPVRPPRPADKDLPPFPDAERCRSRPHEVLRTPRRTRTITEDVGQERLEIHDLSDGGRTRLIDTGLEVHSRIEDRFSIVEDDPLSATAMSSGKMGLRRDDWEIRAETFSRMTADADHFYVTHVLDAYDRGVRVFNKTWHVKIPRHLV